MRTALALLLLVARSAAAEPMFELGVGGGALSGYDEVEISRTTTLVFQGAFNLRESVDVVVGFEGFSANYSPEPRNEQSILNVVAGLRWFPYGRAPKDDIEPRALYAHAMAGASLLTLIPYDSFFETNDPDAAGLVGGAALGWMPAHVGNVSFAFEGRGNAILYNADAGLRLTLSFYFLLQVDFD